MVDRKRCGGGRADIVGDDADQVRRLDRSLAPALTLGMTGNLDPAMHDAQFAGGDLSRDQRTNQPPRDAVAVGIEVDAAVGVDPSHHLPHLAEWGPARQRLQSTPLVASEALERRLACRAVDADVGHLPQPPREVTLKLGPGGEMAAGPTGPPCSGPVPFGTGSTALLSMAFRLT
jgi:hypothetical protein